jgi:hypothetical protein
VWRDHTVTVDDDDSQAAEDTDSESKLHAFHGPCRRDHDNKRPNFAVQRLWWVPRRAMLAQRGEKKIDLNQFFLRLVAEARPSDDDDDVFFLFLQKQNKPTSGGSPAHAAAGAAFFNIFIIISVFLHL